MNILYNFPFLILLFNFHLTCSAFSSVTDEKSDNVAWFQPRFQQEINILDTGYTKGSTLSTTEKTHPFDNKKVETSSESQQCRLYLAKSSIPGSGLGVYSGIDIPRRDYVSSDDLAIPVTDHYSHNGDIEWLLDEYFWTSDAMKVENIAEFAEVAVPTLGMAANSHLGLVNAKYKISIGDNFELDRSKDPGAGAISELPLVSWYASKHIPKGSEIFVNYGENYFETRRSTYGVIPFENNYDHADEIIREFQKVEKTSVDGNWTNQTNGLWKMIYDLAIPGTKAALPEDKKSFEKAKEIGTAFNSVPDMIRSIEWLEEHGRCIDNLTAKRSTISQAGRGAFATRLMLKGSIIATVPLIQLPNRDYLNMYDLNFTNVTTSKDNDPPRTNNTVTGRQLLLNYCFGHRNSSLLLFPYAGATYFINHKSDPNAEIRWSNFSYHKSEWLTKPLEDMPLKHSGLMFDFIATKDIFPGDEVFIDYGREWEDAWNTHVSEWAPLPGSEEYKNPRRFQRDNAVSAVRTISEQETEPYPTHLQTGCIIQYEKTDSNEEGNKGETVRTEISWRTTSRTIDTDYLRPCDILERLDFGKVTLYSARIHNSHWMEEDEKIPMNHEYIVHKIPRMFVRFIEKKYTSNQHLSNVFRHSIAIPDQIFPSTWMNLKEGKVLDTPINEAVAKNQ